jgi:predicted nuclease of predicted toxin-antitoxin system
MRFLADENVSRQVVESLRSAGFDVVSVSATIAGVPDDAVLAAADVEGRILITEDRDFGEMVVRQRLGARGIVLLELDRLSNATEAALVTTVVTTHGDKLAGNLLVIEPGRVRVRPLRR